ncbi:MAG: hypothetical protein LBE71_02220 [Dysgonamonadaceae bacterium]|nr:hypothetical protein [Dysgonamonadaceae bacterium]
MKRTVEFLKEHGLVMLAITLLCSLFGICDAGAMTADVVSMGEGGVGATNQISTSQFTNEASEDLNLPDVQRKVVKINAGASPLTQFSFYALKEKATSMVQELYLVDILPDSTTLKAAYVEPNTNGVETVTLDTNNNGIFSAKETIIFPLVKGYNETGEVQTEHFFMGYILKKTDEGKLIVKAVNGKKIGATNDSVPSLEANTKILRCGRAHNEIDMGTEPYALVPTKETQYLQKFRCQVEESTLEKIAKKEADWKFSDKERAAVDDMKRGMSKSYLLGVKNKIYDEKRLEVYTTEGVYWQAGKEFLYGANAERVFTYEELIRLTEMAFTGGNGNKNKYFLVGSGLMTNLSLIKDAQNFKLAKSTHVKYGITFKEIETNFGNLYVVHDETFDRMDMRENGFIFDPSLLRKHSIVDMAVKDFDLRESAQRDVDARSITDISCLWLQNRLAHIRVAKYNAA